MSSAQSTPLRLGPGVVGDVELVSTTDLKKRLSSILDGVAHHQPVVISRHDQPTAVLISLEDYTRLVEQIPDPIEALRQQFSDLLQRVSASGAEAASDQVYAGTPAEANAILERAHAQANQLVDQARQDAIAERERQLKATAEEVALQVSRARDTLRGQVATLAVAGAEKLAAAAGMIKGV